MGVKAAKQSATLTNSRGRRPVLAASGRHAPYETQPASNASTRPLALRGPAAIVWLQRTVGNRATLKTLRWAELLQRAPEEAKPKGDQGTKPAPSEEKSVPQAPEAGITISYDSNADQSVVSAYTVKVLTDILKAAGESSARISSTARDAHNQARVMYANIEEKGVASQKELYGPSGDKVIDVYVASKKAGKQASEIIKDMEAKINELGPSNVSRHCADPAVLGVIDVAPSSIKHKSKFIDAAGADKRVSKFLQPPNDPAYHLEIPQGK